MFSRIVPLAIAMVIPAAGVTISLSLAASPALAQDAQAGAVVFKRCAACHTTTGRVAIGPPLNGVVGRAAGTVPGYTYSKAMAARRTVWDRATLDQYLIRPQAAVPGTKMGFAGLSNPKDRQDVIAYLSGFKK